MKIKHVFSCGRLTYLVLFPCICKIHSFEYLFSKQIQQLYQLACVLGNNTGFCYMILLTHSFEANFWFV